VYLIQNLVKPLLPLPPHWQRNLHLTVKRVNPSSSHFYGVFVVSFDQTINTFSLFSSTVLLFGDAVFSDYGLDMTTHE
jgi:hypothetical protein